MTSEAWSVAEAVERVNGQDPNLVVFYLFGKKHRDSELGELADCLLAHPDVIKRVHLARHLLTDETGVKLAQYLAASSTVLSLNLSSNKFAEATYLAVAAALRVNSSLRGLHLYDNQAVDQARIDAAFVDALRLNPDCPAGSVWWLYARGQDDFKRLKDAADELGHPSLQMLLALLC